MARGKPAVERFREAANWLEASKTTQMKFRSSKRLHDLIEEAGNRNRWGASEEIRQRLEASFAQSPVASNDPWFGDLLIAINQAAAGAAELRKHPPLPAGVWERNGERKSYDVAEWGQDTTAYETFVEAVRTLMIALAPEGIITVSPETGLRLADQLVALALGALGERGIAAFANLPEVDKQFMKSSGGAAAALALEAEKRDEESEP